MQMLWQRRWRITGQVQGVGFRPFVYRLAQQFNLRGWVQNQLGQVEVLAQGELDALQNFAQALLQQAPPLAKPQLEACGDWQAIDECDPEFVIRHSQAEGDRQIYVPSDYFVCPDCLRELQDPLDRRYRYPFINCTQCGPRYTLITRLPYDRPNTTMADFPLCSACEREYRDPANRRFHAQPVACPVCGPQLQWIEFSSTRRKQELDNEAALQYCLEAFKKAEIVAVKGIGGYHLMCDASNDQAVQSLRERKQRPHKPLAVMFPMQGADDLQSVRNYLHMSAAEAAFLASPMRPILLLRQKTPCALSQYIAPDLQEIGAFLPYSPLHFLLLHDFAAPLVATSANISGEPVLTENQEVEQRLAHITRFFLHHNRPIQRPADDPVFRFIADKARPLRLGRGCAPLEL